MGQSDAGPLVRRTTSGAASTAAAARGVALDFDNPSADVWQFNLDPTHFDQPAGFEPAIGADGGRAFAVYDVRYRPTGGATGTDQAALPYRLYLECREMSGGAWVLGIAHLVPAAAYDAEVAARDALLATIDG